MRPGRDNPASPHDDIPRGQGGAQRRERSLPGSVLDVTVYAPLGVAAAISKGIPGLAEDGRALLERRLLTARTTGELVTTIARRRLEQIVAERSAEWRSAIVAARHPGASVPQGAPTGPPAAAGPGAGTPREADTSRHHRSPAADIQHEVVTRPKESSIPAVPAPERLPIAGYDSLAASQIISRLQGLDDDELALIELHEQLNRHRRTVLSKLAQLRAV